MKFSSAYLTQFGSAFKIGVAMHELGHAFGFPGNTCAGQSVMSPQSATGFHVAYFTQCDQDSLTSNFGQPQEDYCAGGGCTPGYAPLGTPGCSEASIDECGCCLTYSPIILDLASNGVPFSGPEDGAVFTINHMRKRARLGWPVGSDDAWLWRDVNNNGLVDHGGELFGNTTLLTSGQPAAHGFMALAELDTNFDGQVDAADPAFQDLKVWWDRNRDGYSQPAEVAALETTNVLSISVFSRESRRRDSHGNLFKYRAEVRLAGVPRRTWAWDVYPAVGEPQPRDGISAACERPSPKIWKSNE